MVQTALDTARCHYQYTSNEPIHGTEQGSESFSIHWTFISVSMMDTLKQLNK